jgi:hypothetical protein
LSLDKGYLDTRQSDAEVVDGDVTNFSRRSPGSPRPITEKVAVPSSRQVLSTAS